MNHIYRIVWNASLGTFQAVSEIARGYGGRSGNCGGRTACVGAGNSDPARSASPVPLPGRLALACMLLAGTVYPAYPAYAGGSVAGNPQVVAGNASIAGAGNVTTVTQQSGRAVINWNNFSVGPGQVVQFVQPGATSAILNRVTGGSPSAIYGAIHANGEVFLINPSGVLIGPGGVVNAGTFVASTLNVSNAAFMAGGNLNFAGNSMAGIQNFGFVKATNGDVVLVGHTVDNAGALLAPNGTAALAAGNSVQLTDTANTRVVVEVGLPGSGGTGASNEGTIRAAQAEMTAAGGNVYALAVKAGGLIDATGVTGSPDGRVLLTADNGNIQVGGQIQASNADGSGGTILVGGGAHGADASVPDAANLTVAQGAQIDANATSRTGNGGNVVLWSNGQTQFAGSVSAQGGAAGGAGGSAEVSGKGTLDMLGTVNLLAPHGLTGTLLLDPDDVDIDTSSTAVNGSNGGITTVSAAWINQQLNSSALTIQTNNGVTGGNGDITFLDSSGQSTPFSTSLPNTLTINAARDINVNTPIQISASSTGGNAAGGTAGVTGANVNVGALNLDAGRDINLNQPISLNVSSTGGNGDAGSAAAGGAGGSITTGGIDLNAGGNINAQSGIVNIAVSASSSGGAGGASAGGVVAGDGGAGGTINLGALSVTAGGTLATGYIQFNLTTTGGAGGTGATGGNGGAAGAITAQGANFTAGDTTTGLTLNGISVAATATGGAGGAGVSYLNPIDGALYDAGGNAGNINTGNLVFSAPTLTVNGGVVMTATSTYGTGGKQGGGNGGNAGNITTGSLSMTATSGNITTGSLFDLQFSAPPDATLGVGGSGSNGQPGIVTEGAAALQATMGSILLGNSYGNASLSLPSGITLNAGQNIELQNATIVSPSGSVTMIAGQNISLQSSNVNPFIPSTASVTLVADNDYPAAPGFGTGTISLDTASSINAQTVSVFAVSPSYVNFGSWAAPAVVGTGSADYYGQPGTSGSGVYYKVPANGQLLDVTANNATATYGQALPAFTATYSGLVNGDTSSVVTGLKFATTAQVGSNVGTYTITPYGASAPGYYTIDYISGTLTINPASLIVTANNASNQYGQATPLLSDTVTGLYSGDSASQVYMVSPNVTTAPPASGIYNAGTYTINPGVTLLSSNYTLVQNTGTLTVSRAPLTVTANNASMSPTATALPALSDTVSGLVNGDAQSGVVSLNPTTTATVGANSGTYVIHPGATLLSNNYALDQVNGTLTVLTAGSSTLDITANNASATYGQALPAFSASYNGFINGDTPSVVSGLQFSTNAHVGANAGTYTITPYGATVPAYYSVVYVPGVLTINPASLMVTANNASTTYGTAPALSDTVNGLVNGDIVANVVSLNPTATAAIGANVGTYTINPGASLLSGNYALTQIPGTLTINPAVLTVTAPSLSTTYGTIRQVLPGTAADTVSGLVNGDTVASVLSFPYYNGPYILFSNSTNAYLNAGTYTISPGAWLHSNNYVLNQVNGTLTINPAVLTVTASNASTIYGNALPALSGAFDTISGLVPGDQPSSVVSLAPQFSASARGSANPAAGTYAISPGATLLNSNYTLNQVNGTLTVNPASLGVSVLAVGIVRGDNPGSVVSQPGANAPIPTVSAPSGEEEVLVSYSTQYGETASVLLGITGLAKLGVAQGTNGIPIPLSQLATLLGGAPAFTIGNWSLGTLPSGYTNVYVPNNLAVGIGSLQSTSKNYTISSFSGLGGSGAVIPGVTVFNPTLVVSVPATYAWFGASLPPVMQIFTGLRGSLASSNGTDLDNVFPGTWGATSNYNPANPVSGVFTLTPTGPSVAYNGDGYGPYNVQFSPGSLTVLNADGSLPSVAVSSNVSASGGRVIANIGTISSTIPALMVEGPTVFGIPMAFSPELLSAVEAYLQSQGLPSDTASAYNWMSANAGSNAMAGVVLPYVITEVTSLESQGNLSPDQQAFVNYIEAYLDSQKHAAAVEALQQYNAWLKTPASQGPAASGMLSLFNYWSGTQPPPASIMALSETGVDTSSLSATQQTALAQAMEAMAGVAGGAATGAAVSSVPVLTTIMPNLIRAGTAVADAVADTAAAPAAGIAVAFEILAQGIAAFAEQAEDVKTLKNNAEKTSFPTLADTFGKTLQVNQQIAALEAQGVSLPAGWQVMGGDTQLTTKQQELVSLKQEQQQLATSSGAAQLQDTTMLTVLMTGGSTYSFGSSLPPQAVVAQATAPVSN